MDDDAAASSQLEAEAVIEVHNREARLSLAGASTQEESRAAVSTPTPDDSFPTAPFAGLDWAGVVPSPSSSPTPADTPSAERAAPNHADTGTDAGGLADVDEYADSDEHADAGADDPEPARITSDITPDPDPPAVLAAPPATINTPQVDSNSQPVAQQAVDSAVQKNIQRRAALQAALKRRWESGAMDHVHRKRVATLRRRKEEEYLTTQTHLQQWEEEQQQREGSIAAPTIAGPSTGAASTYAQPTHGASDNDGDWTPSEASVDSSLSISSPAPEMERLFFPKPPKALELTESGRLYKSWKDGPLGILRKSGGVLLPDTYKLSDSFPGRPWICPVRTCQKVFTALVNLGAHFINEHRATLLHDNMDGTMSIKGFYQADRHGPNTALVVSRSPPSALQPPPVASSIPAAAARLLAKTSNEESPFAAPSSSSPAEKMDDAAMLEASLAASRPAHKATSDNWRDLWGYLQRFLIRHKGPSLPEKGWVSELISLPRVRELAWNTIRQAQHPFKDSKPRDVSALIIQLTGEEAPQPCTRCVQGKGPFAGCVIMSRNAHMGPLRNVISCANCFYHYGQTYCSHKFWAGKRAEAIVRERIKEDPDLGARFGAFMQDLDNAAGDEDTTIDVDEVKPHLRIDATEDGRPYSMWRDPQTGELIPAASALLPTGYQPGATDSREPWVCPIRTCRRPHVRVEDLGEHFQRAHFACLLRDNKDGTFSELGVFSASLSTKKTPCMVISRAGDGSASQPPPSSTNQPRGSLIDSDTESYFDESSCADAPRTTNDTSPLWDYMKRFIQRKDMPQSAAIFQLLVMPRRRELEMNPLQSHRVFVEKSPRDVAAMALQLTGEEAPKACDKCRQGKGLFSKCVIIDSRTGKQAKARYKACANCLYHGGQTYCNLKDWTANRDWLGASSTAPEPVSATAVRSTTLMAPSPISNTPAVRSNGTIRATNSFLLDTKSPSLQNAFSEALASFNGAPYGGAPFIPQQAPPLNQPARTVAAGVNRQIGAEVPATQSYGLRKSSRPQQSASATVPARTQRPHGPPPSSLQLQAAPCGVGPATSPATTASSSLIHAGALQPTDILEMETWEVAPGRISASSDTNPENIAFSKAYLSTNHVVPVFDDVTFRVDTIHSGATLQIEPDATKARICSIATGKVRVRTGDEPEFAIGPHGMFKVKPGVACSVQNWMYVDAVLHITVLDGFT